MSHVAEQIADDKMTSRAARADDPLGAVAPAVNQSGVKTIQDVVGTEAFPTAAMSIFQMIQH